MNTKYLRNTLFLSLLMGAAGAAESPAPDSATNAQLEQRLHSANDKLNEAAREVGELSQQLYGAPWGHTGSRAILGINVGEEGSNKLDDGVRVLSVSPGGPAAVAGLKPNDVIVAFEGKKLQKAAGKSPRQQLLLMTRAVEPDSTVTLDIERDGNAQTLKVTPKGMTIIMDDGGIVGVNGFGKQFDDKEFTRQFEAFSEQFESIGIGSAEFVELTPGLGRYFGTDKGLLVVRPPKDASLKLEEGDVILDIDGRVPTNASHAVRILNSYRSGESMKLHIMRQQRRVELAVVTRADKPHASMLPLHGAMMPTRSSAPAHELAAGSALLLL